MWPAETRHAKVLGKLSTHINLPLVSEVQILCRVATPLESRYGIVCETVAAAALVSTAVQAGLRVAVVLRVAIISTALQHRCLPHEHWRFPH
jgi:hypothetical protein